MNEFCERWGKLTKHERRKVRHEMLREAVAKLSSGLPRSSAQLRAEARIAVDRAIARVSAE